MNTVEEDQDSSQRLPFLQVYKFQNDTIYGYPQKHSPYINGLCSNQYFGLMNIFDIKSQQLLISQCCILISPIHAITTNNQLMNEQGQLNYTSDQIQVIFNQNYSLVTSYVQLDRFLLLTLQQDFGESIGYVGLMSRELENIEEQTNLNKKNTPYIQGLNEKGTISYFQSIVYRENTFEIEIPNCGFIRLLQGCALLKYDEEFGICLHGLVSYSDEKQRVVVQKLLFNDILIISEVILAAGVIMSEKKIDINALYSLDQKTFLNPKSKIYRKSLSFEKNIQSLEQKKSQQLQIIDLKVINQMLLSAISKQGDLYIINMENNSIEQTIPLEEQPSLLQVIHDELFIGLNKRLLVINYVQHYSPVRTYQLESQVLSLLCLEDSQNIQNVQYLIGCFNGLYLLKINDKLSTKVDIPKTNLNKVLNLQINQEINYKSPLNSYNLYQNQNEIILSTSEKILIVDWQQKNVKRNFIGHSKNVYFIEQVRANLLLSGSSDCSLILWDKQNGSLLKQLQFSHPLYYGYLLNPSELVTIDYNTVRIFNTVTFQYTKYEYHQKPITSSMKISASTFITCDTSNQIILWKADTFIAQAFMDSEFKIRKNDIEEVNGTQFNTMKFSENEKDFDYKPHNLKGPILLKYQLQLEDSKKMQERLKNTLEEQICQNIEDRLIYQQRINSMEKFISKKNKELKRITSQLGKKKSEIGEVFQDIQEQTEELQNYVTFQNNSRDSLGKNILMNSQTSQSNIEKGDNQAFNSVDTMATGSLENLMTVKKQGNIYIDDFQQTQQKNSIDNANLYKSSHSQQFSSQKTKNAYENEDQLKQFDTGQTQTQNVVQRSSIYNSNKNNYNSNQTEQQKSRYSTETKQQRSREESLQYDTVKRQSHLQNNKNNNNQYLSNHFQHDICNPLQDSIINNEIGESSQINQFKDIKGSGISQNNKQYNEEESMRPYSNSLQQIMQSKEQYESEIKQIIQTPPFYDLNNQNDQYRFIIKPLPIDSNQVDMNDQTEFALTESNLVSDKRQALLDKSFEQYPSKQSYIQQLNEILNSMQNIKSQNQKQSQISSTSKKQDIQSENENKQSIQTNVESQKLPLSNNQNNQILNQILDSSEKQITPKIVNSQIYSSGKKDQIDMTQSQLKSYLEESIIDKKVEEEQEQKFRNSLKEKNLNSSGKQKKVDLLQKSSEKQKSDKKGKDQNENLLRSIKKMERMEDSLLKNDPLLLELYSLIKSNN